MTRHKLDDRRPAVREKVFYKGAGGNDHLPYEVSFGFDRDGVIREVFCEAAKTGTDLQGLIHDACITMSIALQHGETLASLCSSYGESPEAGTGRVLPASPLGAIARAGILIEAMMGGRQ